MALASSRSRLAATSATRSIDGASACRPVMCRVRSAIRPGAYRKSAHRGNSRRACLTGASLRSSVRGCLPAGPVPGDHGRIPFMPTQSKWQSLPTEAINPVSLAVDKAPVLDIVEMVVNEDRKVIAAVHKEKERIAHGVEIVTHALRKGGRVIFVGAGTSGRLGVVEASEMPPTFGTSPSLVQAVMAGGQEAVFRAKEGVEDNFEEGARSIARLRLTRKDVVIGVSASGMTPFVRGGLTRARKAGAKIIFVTCWPGSELQNFVDLQIAPAVGPEIIAGSTRLKAGTATKMVLNMLTTISMIQVGKTYGNLMVDLRSGSEKLKDRARRILVMVTGIT